MSRPGPGAEDIVAASFGASRLDASLFGLADGWGQLDEHAFDVAFDVRQGLGLVLDDLVDVLVVEPFLVARTTEHPNAIRKSPAKRIKGEITAVLWG